MKIAIPSYFYPGKEWNRMLAKKPAFVIINPHNGVGDKDENYEQVADSARRAGVHVVGYVYTKWGKRKPEEISGEIKTYNERYPLHGVFFDEASTNPEHLDYYKGLLPRRGRRILNPGTFPDEKYAKLPVILAIYETDMDTYLAKEPPAWVRKYPASKFWHIIHSVPDECAARKVARVAMARNAGYIWITDDTGDNPYDQLPAYYEQLRKIAANRS